MPALQIGMIAEYRWSLENCRTRAPPGRGGQEPPVRARRRRPQACGPVLRVDSSS
jgi:hypothetical protein